MRYVTWLQKDATPEKEIKRADLFINLAGVSINDGRWTKKHRKAIYHSRIRATEELIRMMAALNEKPKLLLNASAIGVYPPSSTVIYDEHSIAQSRLGLDISVMHVSMSTYGLTNRIILFVIFKLYFRNWTKKTLQAGTTLFVF